MLMKKILCMIILMVSAVCLQAQNLTVRGTVSDESGALPGVTVLVEGTGNGVITDLDGHYSVKVKKGGKLTFSYVGYKTQTIVVNQETLDVTLKADAIMLDEAVVVGYAVQKKATLTGAVSQVSAKEITKRNVASLSTAILLIDCSAPFT